MCFGYVSKTILDRELDLYITIFGGEEGFGETAIENIWKQHLIKMFRECLERISVLNHLV